MSEKSKNILWWFGLLVVFVASATILCNKQTKYEEIHDPYIEEDGNVTKREIK